MDSSPESWSVAPASQVARGGRLRTLGLAALGFVALSAIYLWRTQAIMHSDGPRLFLTDGTPGTLHFLYSPTLAAWRAIWEPLGLSRHFVTSALSSFSAAFAVLCIFFATRRLASSGVAAATAVLAATAPAIFFYATTVEIHAVMFGVFGLVAVATSHLLVRPTFGRAIVVGVLCGVGYLMHNTGALLPSIPIAMLVARHRVRGRFWTIALLIVAHAVVVFAGNAVFVIPNGQHPGSVFDGSVAESLGRPFAVLTVLWQEWVWAFFPVSIWFLWALRRTAARRLVVAILVMLVPYFCVTFVLMAGYSSVHVMYEKGAYLMPLVWPCAWLVATISSRWIVTMCVLLGLVASAQHIYHGVDHDRNISFQAGLAEASGAASPFVLIGKWRDWEACMLAEPRIEARFVSELGLYTPELQSQVFEIMTQDIRRRIEGGQPVFVTERAMKLLRDCEEQGLAGATAMLAWLAEAFALVPVDQRGFRGHALTLRS